jgi:hypothetical protein
MRAQSRRAILASDKRTHADPGGQIMVRYFYAWTPLVIITAVFLLSAPWLGLIALMIISLVALTAVAALAWAVVVVPLHMLSRAIGRRSHSRSGARRLAPAALSPPRRQNASLAIRSAEPEESNATV